MEEKVRQRLNDHISGNNSLVIWLSGNIRAIYYTLKPKGFRIFGLLHFLTRAFLASAAPVLAYYYETIKFTPMIVASGGLFFGNLIAALLDKFSRQKTQPEVDGKADFVHRFGDLLNSYQAKQQISKEHRDDAIRSLLGIIEIYSRIATKSTRGEISVSLVLYKGSGTAHMSIKHRNPGNFRPMGRDFPSGEMWGHYVCQNGNFPQLINDVKLISRRRITSPTSSTPDYRSILFVPMETVEDGEARIRGFVSIDSRRPFAFYGNRDGDILVTCEPIFSHIRHLI